MSRRLKSLRIFTSIWGDKYLDWAENGLFKSLAWPKNKEALINATWAFVTKKEHVGRIENLVKDSQIAIGNVEILLLGEEFDKNPHAAGMFLKEAFLSEIGRSITFDCQTLIAPPDTIFGDGTIKSLREIGAQRDSVVFAAHVRVLPDIFNKISHEKMTNAVLVSAAFRSLHKTWEEAQVGLIKANSYVGGVSWRDLDDNLYSVTHRLPTPYLCNFTPEDMVYFKNQIHFGELDHGWPSVCLIDTQRQRMVGSSDAAFMVEITEPGQNIPPVDFVREESPDEFWRDRENRVHNKVNRMTSIIFRGE